MRCPNCRTLILVPAGEAVSASRLMHCPRCPAAWVSRHEQTGVTPSLPPMIRRGPLIVEADTDARASRGFARRFRRAIRRPALAAIGAAMAVAVLGAAMVAPGVSARPVLAILEGGR